MSHDKSTYLAWRHQFEPVPIRLIIVAESPPASDKFFYNPDGDVSDQLFSAMMQQLNVSPGTKIEGSSAYN